MERTTAIVPTYQRAAYLAQCLEAILAQTLAPAEIIVVDDGSGDETAATVARFGEHVRFVEKPRNSGKADSLNLGLSLASHPLVWIVDDDDIVLPDALARLTALLAEDPQAGFAYGRHLRFRDDPRTGERVVLDTGHWPPHAPGEMLVATLEDFFAHQPGMLVRKRLYDAVGPFDTALDRSQDYDMLIRLAAAAPAVGTDAVVFLQRVHAGMRGSAAKRFSADQATAKWMATDRRILGAARTRLPLDAYLPGARLPGGARPLDGAGTRRALLQRAVVMMRKRLWDEALSDLDAAAEMHGTDTPGTNAAAPLTPDERLILRRAFASKYGVGDIVTDARIRAMLIAAARRGAPIGLGPALARGLRWRVREALVARRPGEALRIARFALALRHPTRARG
ncbi:glycosyltransferase family A protein [Salinarimonas ramus]|uniref:Glycosyltransferase 2-like domain-containing protein n=1 Tax=Salinarimonas ramus TaxID=690164 RepID=A0A917QAJ1_9HYPH|nr:glycosyltransferase family A protein [Salinarimonas ramus]GGK38990.1 hypothetical protein GCM10011322_27590 [Salinarimonas ramus]